MRSDIFQGNFVLQIETGEFDKIAAETHNHHREITNNRDPWNPPNAFLAKKNQKRVFKNFRKNLHIAEKTGVFHALKTYCC